MDDLCYPFADGTCESNFCSYFKGKEFTRSAEGLGVHPSGFVSVATAVNDLRGQVSTSNQREQLITKIASISAQDITALPNNRMERQTFRGSLISGESVIFSPLAWSKWDTPRLLLIYSEISRSVHVQKLFG